MVLMLFMPNHREAATAMYAVPSYYRHTLQIENTPNASKLLHHAPPEPEQY